MRAYALLLGVVLTVGSVSVAELAVQSVGSARGGGLRAARARAASDAIWYGGMIEPITINARGSTRAAVRASEPAEPGDARAVGARLSKQHQEASSE